MKKTGSLNHPISAIIPGLGHTDRLVVCDAGLPIPDGINRIDMALKEGVPTFLQTVEVVLTEMQVERAIIASEILDKSPEIEKALRALLGDIPIDTIPHEQFKDETKSAKAIIRTGEFSPFANVILSAGVVF